MKKFKVSIVTICYNSEKTIEDTIKSVLSQDYDNTEYIIKDGVSKDNTIEIIKKYEKDFGKKLKWCSTKDKGLYDAMNEGLKMATGDIVGIINSDDVLANGKVISTIVEEFNKVKCDATYGDLVFMDADTMSLPARNFIGYKESKVFGWQMPHPTLYLKKEIYKEIGYFNTDYRIAADLDFMYRLIYTNKYKISYIKKYLVIMRAGGVSTAGIRGYVKNLKESYHVSKKNRIYLPLLSNIFRIFKTIWQGVSAKLFKNKIIKRIQNYN